MIDDVSGTAQSPYCTISHFVPPRSGVPFHDDKLSWDNQCQELYVHQSHAAETSDCQPLHHGERDMSLCRLSLGEFLIFPQIGTLRTDTIRLTAFS
jgi:hypothetical protein